VTVDFWVAVDNKCGAAKPHPIELPLGGIFVLTLSRSPFQTLAGTVKVAFQRTALIMVLVLQVISLPAHAGNLSAADEKSVRAVVEGQLAAFAKDDADKAFSFAAPNVRKALGSAANFMSMVRSDYPVVYRPTSVAF
jgi:hypothetical protein